MALLFLSTATVPAYAGCPAWLCAVGRGIANIWLGKPNADAIGQMLERDYVPWTEIAPAYARLARVRRPDALALVPAIADIGMGHEDDAIEAAQILASNIEPPALLPTAAGAIAGVLAAKDAQHFKAAALFFCSLLNGPSGFYLIGQEPLANRTSEQRRRLLTLVIAVVLARGYDSSALPWSSLEADGNDDIGSLLRWLMVSLGGDLQPMGTTATGALAEVLPRLPSLARKALYEITAANVEPRVLASILPKLILEEENHDAWESAMASYTEAMEAIAADETQSAAFAKSVGFRFIEAMPNDIRSRPLRQLQGGFDMLYDQVAASPPYMNRYNARLFRIDAARDKIRAAYAN